MNDLMPRYRFGKLTDITPEDLKEMGADAVALDVDNTIAYDCSPELIEGVEEWIAGMKAQGVPMVIVSNGTVRRVKPLAERLGLAYTAMAMKPRGFGFRRAAKRLGVPIHRMAAVGDQLFTDIRGANRSGAVSVYVNPVRMETRMVAVFEKRRGRERPILEQFDREHGVPHKEHVPGWEVAK